MLSPRQAATESGARHYHGSPCARCTGTLRYVKSGKCYACAQSPLYRASEKNAKRAARKAAYKRENREATNASNRRRTQRIAARQALQRATRAALRKLASQARHIDRSIESATRSLQRDTARISYTAQECKARRALARQRRKAKQPQAYRDSQRKKRRARNDRETAQGRPPGRIALRQLLEDQGYACAYCPATEQLELDHRYPVVHGGSGALANCQYLCRACNNLKRDIPDLDYRRIKGLMITADVEANDYAERYRL